MNINKRYSICWLVLLAFAVVAKAEPSPSIHDVYAAAESGRLTDAQQMMAKVLQEHPGSGKAHYVEAELLAGQGRVAEANSELKVAERLAPGLPFATRDSVAKLENLLNGNAPIHSLQTHANNRSTRWMEFLLVGSLLALLFAAVRALFARRNQQLYGGVTGYGGAPAGPTVSAGGGIGSSVLGGLATGAAVGAGVVAGEALAHHFLDDDRRDRMFQPDIDQNAFAAPTQLQTDDMGGADFGIGDASSWDDDAPDLNGGDGW